MQKRRAQVALQKPRVFFYLDYFEFYKRIKAERRIKLEGEVRRL